MNPVHIQITHKTSRSQTNIRILSVPGADFGGEFLQDLNDRYPGKVPIRTLSLVTSEQPPVLRLASRKPVMVNGVEVRQKKLEPGDVLFLGPLRIRFKIGEPDVSGSLAGAAAAAVPPEPPREEIVVPAGVAEPPAGFELEPPQEIILEPEAKTRVLPKVPAEKGRVFRILIPAALVFGIVLAFGIVFLRPTFRNSRELPAELPIPKVQKSEPAVLPIPVLPYGTGPVVTAPGMSLPDIPVQVLFIHAHPDDESLDYGAFLAWCETRGLNTAVVLLTDGESGLDLYPGRQIGEGYPDKSLSGAELADVRIREATLAMKTLGVDAYIRMGLPNHPYNGKADEISPKKIMENWGGEARVILELGKIIDHFKPEVIVSPDGPSAAREHFEHETTGLLVSRTLTELARKGDTVPSAHITCIDPRQKSVYPDRVDLDGGFLFKATGKDETLRDVQMRALGMHKTQNDAFIIGREFLAGYPREFYQIRYWNRDDTWEEFLDLTGR